MGVCMPLEFPGCMVESCAYRLTGRKTRISYIIAETCRYYQAKVCSFRKDKGTKGGSDATKLPDGEN